VGAVVSVVDLMGGIVSVVDLMGKCNSKCGEFDGWVQ
jgi:hypothetical protein